MSDADASASIKITRVRYAFMGLPSLRADMYQQNVLRAELASEQVGAGLDGVETRFAPANDPFVLRRRPCLRLQIRYECRSALQIST